MFFHKKQKESKMPLDAPQVLTPQSIAEQNGVSPCTASVPEKRKPMIPVIGVYHYIEQGNRQYQQDAVYTSHNGSVPLSSNKVVHILTAVCDGMGGMEDGSKASSTAIQMLREGFVQAKNMPGFYFPNFLYERVRQMDQVIHNFPSRTGHGSGTTMVAVALEDNKMYWISAGDSRIYLLRNGQLQQMTRDHNYMLQLMQMVENGQISREQAMAQKNKEALISFLGIGDIELVDRNMQPYILEMGDMVLLCSDGITKTIQDGQIREILMSPISSLEEKAKVLVQAATRKNTRSQDNTSAVILEYVMKDIKEL